MGMTPLEGLVMGTRCGDIDPAIHFYLCKNLGLDNETLEDLLNRQSGLLGLCGVNDMREIQRLAERRGRPGGAGDRDLLPTGSRSTSAPTTRSWGGWTPSSSPAASARTTRTCAAGPARTWTALGIKLDDAANLASERGERRISTPESPVQVLVIPTNEELAIAQQALAAVQG